MKAAHAPPLRTHLNLGVSFIKLRSPGACNLLRQSQSWSKWLGVLGAKGSCIQRLQPLRKDMQYSRSWPLRLEETSAVEIPNPDPCSNFDTLGLCLSIVERKLNWLEHDSTRCEQSSSLAAALDFRAFSNTPLNGYHYHLLAMFWNYSSPYPKPPVEKIQATSPKMKPKSMWKKWPSGVICKLSRWRSPMPRTWRIAGGSFHEWRKYNIHCTAYNSWKMLTENPNRKLVEVHSGQPKCKSWQQNEI